MDRLMLRHNVVTRRVEYRALAPDPEEGMRWAPVSDRVVNSLWSELSAEKAVRVQDIYRELRDAALEHSRKSMSSIIARYL